MALNLQEYIEMHSFGSHITDHFVFEWKSTLKKNDSDNYFGADSTPKRDDPYSMAPKGVNFHSTALREREEETLTSSKL